MTDRADGFVRPNRNLAIPVGEIEWQFSGSGGPGGQHANTSNTRVELRFDVAASPSLSMRARDRLLERIGPSVRIVVSETRSQSRNREIALARLEHVLAGALREVTPRRPTRPTKAAKLRRLAAKQQRGDVKRARQRPGTDD
jgi:ribosome-associated protein